MPSLSLSMALDCLAAIGGSGALSRLYRLPLLIGLFDTVSGFATSIRPSNGTVLDFEQVMHECLDNEVRESGARRVHNRIKKSDDLSDVGVKNGWGYLGNDTIVFTPNSELRLNGVDLAVPSSFILSNTLPESVNNTPLTVIVKLWIKGLNGTTDWAINIYDGSHNRKSLTITNQWELYTVTVTTDGTGDAVNAYLLDTRNGNMVSGTYKAAIANIEFIILSGTQTVLDDFVSVGELSAPWHGAGVDGVQYFDTDRSGTTLTTMIGALVEPAATNYYLNSGVPVTQAAMVNAGTVVSTVTVTGDITLTVDGAAVTSAATYTYTPAGATSDIQVTGGTTGTVQFEAGAISTSYIKTVGDSVTRVADEIDQTIPATTGDISILCDVYHRQTITGNVTALYLTDGTANNTVEISLQDGKVKLDVVTGGVSQVSTTTATVLSLSAINKIGVRVSANDFSVVLNGIAIGSDVSGTVPTGLTTVDAGHKDGTNELNANISGIDIKDAALSDAQLITETT